MPLAILTWWGIALALLVFIWPLGILACFGAALLTEQLIIRYRRSQEPAVRRSAESLEDVRQ